MTLPPVTKLSLKTKDCQFDNFVITSGPVSCRDDSAASGKVITENKRLSVWQLSLSLVALWVVMPPVMNKLSGWWFFFFQWRPEHGIDLSSVQSWCHDMAINITDPLCGESTIGFPTQGPCNAGFYCPACRTTFIATRFRVAVICPIIPVPHCIRVFFYFVWFVFINHIFQFYYELCTYCNILDIYLS